MFRVQKLNKMSTKGLDLLPRDNYELASDLPNPDAVLVRSLYAVEYPILISVAVTCHYHTPVSS